MQSTYRLNVNELDQKFIEAIKLLFRDKAVEITITEVDETSYLMRSEANYRRFREAVADVNSGFNLVSVDLDV